VRRNSDPAAKAIFIASHEAADMKRERFVDMEAFSRSIMPLQHSVGSKAFYPSAQCRHVGNSLWKTKAPDRS
jgi:hypothetical protein